MRSVSLVMWLRQAVLVATILIILSSTSFAQAVRVIDGDTLELLDQTYRLHGIDAPEMDQMCNTGNGSQWPCGKAAKAKLISLIDNKPIVCVGSKKDRCRRVIANCYCDTLNLNVELVRTGHSWAYRQYTSHRY
jgi:endonuclease YncB( thermonuclease family)